MKINMYNIHICDIFIATAGSHSRLQVTVVDYYVVIVDYSR